MFNILNGGKHAQDSTDFQEFMVMPVGLPTYGEALRAGAEVFAALRSILHDDGHATGQGDEGGFAPSLPSNEAAVEVILRAIEKAGYRPGEDVAIALDPGDDRAGRAGHRRRRRTDALRARQRGPDARVGRAHRPLGATGSTRYPIVSIEDGLAEDDWAGWQALIAAARRARSSSSATTCSSRTPAGSPAAIEEDAANAVLSSSTRSAR